MTSNTCISFSDWLISTHNFSLKVVRDTNSRIKRCTKILPLNGKNCDEYLSDLKKESEFQSLSVSVRSQIKRAITLHYQYINEVNNV